MSRSDAILSSLLLAATAGCKQVYLPPVVKNPPVDLVVEGFINNGPDSTYFDLSTTYVLSDSTATTPVTGATVTVEGTDKSSYALPGVGNGLYGAPLPTLNTNNSYRLHIVTSGGAQYASDYVPVVPNPPIDSINFIRKNDGVHVYASTHDPNGSSQYYRYAYEETWQFESPFFAVLQWLNDSLQNYSPNTTHTCWHYDASTTILLATSSQLTKSVIYEAPLVNIPLNSQQISIEYSILAKQYALTKDAYSWWTIMQNNTENIGSIFGVQPTPDQGNLHCLTDSSQQVIGYVSAGTVRSQRIFIAEDQVFPWDYESGCMLDSVPISQQAAYYASGLLPITYRSPTSIDAAWKTCVDCTLTGTNIKPPFWP
jgi:hypothetical protein